jgi:hypothetical protein
VYAQQPYQQAPRYGGGHQYQYQYSAPYPAPPREASGAWAAAVFSIIFAILGGLLGLIFGLIAVYLGKRGMRLGMDKAEAAVQLGYVGIVLSIVMMLVWFFYIL